MAKFLIESRDYLAIGAGREYVRALAELCKAAGNVGGWADRLKELASNPELALDVAEALVDSKIWDVDIVVKFLARRPESITHQQLRHLVLCFRYANWAENNGRQDLRELALRLRGSVRDQPSDRFPERVHGKPRSVTDPR